MKQKHTTGPWVVGISRDKNFGGWPVFSLDHLNDPDDRDELEANAKLIAASPELLIACEEALVALLTAEHTDKNLAINYSVINYSVINYSVINYLRKVIEKAT